MDEERFVKTAVRLERYGADAVFYCVDGSLSERIDWKNG